jgi:DNA-binding winged helix-turn-helix (wHTH) protein
MQEEFEFETQVIVKKGHHTLTSTQSRIFMALLENPEGVDRKDMIKLVYGENYPDDEYSLNKIKNHMSHIRYFLHDIKSQRQINTLKVKKSRMSAGWKLN